MGTLRFELQFVADRWRHAVSLLQGDCWIPVLESVEGSPEDRFPSSPAFQELLLEEKPNQGQEVQLFGQAGKNLYAAAIMLNASTSLIEFDVSVRMRGGEPPQQMVSTYRLGDGFSLENSALPESVVILQPEAEKFLLSCEATETFSCDIAISTGGELQVGCLQVSRESGTGLRWRYCFSQYSHA